MRFPPSALPSMAMLVMIGSIPACAEVLDIPRYRAAPEAAGGAGGTSSGGAGAGATGEAPCGLEDPLWSFDDGMLHGFGQQHGDVTVDADTALDAMVIDANLDPDATDGQDIYVANSFASMDLRGKIVTACLRLLDVAGAPSDLPQLELFVSTGDAETNSYSDPVSLSRSGAWVPVTLDMDHPIRTDMGLPDFPEDAWKLGFKLFTLDAGDFGPVRIAVDAITIE